MSALADVAQLVEHFTRNEGVPGSNPGVGSPMVPADVIELAGQRLAAAARQPARVLLFGSHARGDAGPDSDLDFLVIERDVANRHAEMVRLGREVASLGVPIDVLVVSEAYAEEWGGVKNTVVHAALTEGREFAAA
jgi:predicted nucleotidyltransferase